MIANDARLTNVMARKPQTQTETKRSSVILGTLRWGSLTFSLDNYYRKDTKYSLVRKEDAIKG